MSAQLASLLTAGERAAFHGPPGAAVSVLEQACRVAEEEGRPAEATAASWLLGVSLSSLGRFGGALDILERLLVSAGEPAGPEARLFGALSAATAASVHRQLGRHQAARELDERGASLAGSSAEARFDAELGLGSDAVGFGDARLAAGHLELAATLVAARADWWRQRVRLEWLRAELALLQQDPPAAVLAAERGVELAEAARAPRHVAKSLLYQGLAQLSIDPGPAAATLQRAATLAESLGTLPLAWRARALLGASLAEVDRSAGHQSLAAARSAVLVIANDLPSELREEWLTRPDLAALLEG